MNTLPIDLYKVIEYGLGGDTWQEFIDRYKEKYDLLQIDGFEFEATKLVWDSNKQALVWYLLGTYKCTN